MASTDDGGAFEVSGDVLKGDRKAKKSVEGDNALKSFGASVGEASSGENLLKVREIKSEAVGCPSGDDCSDGDYSDGDCSGDDYSDGDCSGDEGTSAENFDAEVTDGWTSSDADETFSDIDVSDSVELRIGEKIHRSFSGAGQRFLNLLRQGIELTGMRGHRVLVACSGGPDSLALLVGLVSVAPSMDMTVAVGTVDHGLREDSFRDALFVRRMAKALNVPFFERRLALKTVEGGFRGENRPSPGKKTGDFSRQEGRGGNRPKIISERVRAKGGLEALARQARYQALEEMAVEGACDAIATAHTLEDQAETLLMRLGMGTGVRGARGILPCNGSVRRPMLAISRKLVAAFLHDCRLKGRIDSTNSSDAFTRNRVRRLVLPSLEAALGPGVIRCLARFCANAALANEALEYATDEASKRLQADTALFPFDGLFDDPTGELSNRDLDDLAAVEFSVDDLIAMPGEIRFRLLERAVSKAGGRLDFQGFRRLDDAMRRLAPQRIQLSMGVAVTVRYGRLKVVFRRTESMQPYEITEENCDKLLGASPDELPLNIPDFPGETWSNLWKGREVRVRRLEPFERILSMNGESLGVPLEAILNVDFSLRRDRTGYSGAGETRGLSEGGHLGLVLRCRRGGDRFRPKGARGGKKLKAFLIDAKVPVEMRDDLPLLAVENSNLILGIFGLPGLRNGEVIEQVMGENGGLEISLCPCR